MLRVVADSNVKISGLISTNPHSASLHLMRALAFREAFVFETSETVEEFRRTLEEVASRPPYLWLPYQVEHSFQRYLTTCNLLSATRSVPASLARDITDTKFLDLAVAANADFLVTNDRRHLLRLKKIGRTQIVTPHKFMLALRRQST